MFRTVLAELSLAHVGKTARRAARGVNAEPRCLRRKHVHIAKGEYESYDTFIRAEAVQYLRQYLEERRTGRLDPCIRPETITDESPLIRDALWDKTRGSDQPRPIRSKQVFRLVHGSSSRPAWSSPARTTTR